MPIENSHIDYEILAYLAERPDSSDTVEGIVQWWLVEQKIEYQIDRVQEALAELVKNGLILEHKGGDSRVHYRINLRKYEEIQMLLKDQLEGIKIN